MQFKLQYNALLFIVLIMNFVTVSWNFYRLLILGEVVARAPSLDQNYFDPNKVIIYTTRYQMMR